MPVFDRFANESQGVSFQGVGAVLDPSNKFAFPILRAESTTVSINPEKKERSEGDSQVVVSGEQLTLVAGY